MVKTRIIIFVLALLIWLSLHWSIDAGYVYSGIAIGLLISFLTGDLFKKDSRVFKNTKRYLWFLYYVPFFIWECLKANLDGVYRVAHPDLPMRPGIVKVKTTLKSDAGLTFLANSLTLRPGTMTVDIDKENGFLYVHWVQVKDQDIDKATALLVQKFECILKRIFE
ncbi:MAG: Na+/H+ antiporter subunit E [Candidatus Omnitrophica bacterium]|nr:Na+/H+ antiporter subunit E [Candidatus Omnitrophota bacterium]